MVKRLLKDKIFLKAMLGIAIPISIQSLIQASLNMIDQFMIGQLGDTAIASVGLGLKFFSILAFTLGGVLTAASIYASQFWGKKDESRVGEVLGSTLLYGALVTSAFVVIGVAFPERVLGIFTNDGPLIAAGSQYLKIISWGNIPMLFVVSYSVILRCTGHAKLPMYTGMFSVITNIILNYILIFGKFGAPEMGIQGAALATTISRILECVLIIGVIYLKKYVGAYSPRAMFTISNSLMKSFFITMIPLLLSEFFWVLGESAFTVIYGRMGTSELAAMTITYPVQGMSFAFLNGIGVATGIMIGRMLGTDDYEGAYDYSKRFITYGIIGAGIMGVTIILTSGFYVSLFNVSQEVQGFAVKILTMYSLVMWAKVSNMIIAGNILRSGGETKLTFYIESFGMWVIGVPLGYLAAFKFGLPIHWVYLMISLEEIVRMGIGLYLTQSRRWMKNITARIEASV